LCVYKQQVWVSVNNTTISKKRCLIKDDVNYMFRPNVAIIRFTSESMVVLLYRIDMDMSRLSICDVCYMLFIRGTGEGGICKCAILGCAAQVCLLAAVLCGSPATVCPYPMSTAGGLLLWLCGEEKKTKE